MPDLFYADGTAVPDNFFVINSTPPPTKKRTLKEIETLFERHERAEYEMDFPALMATISENPDYEAPALGLRVSGRDAVRELYSRILPRGAKRNIWAEKRIHATDGHTLSREAHVFFDWHGERRTGHYMFQISYNDDDLITSERMYMDTVFAARFVEDLGPDFPDYPGVTVLSKLAPAPLAPLENREAYAALHLANPDH